MKSDGVEGATDRNDPEPPQSVVDTKVSKIVVV